MIIDIFSEFGNCGKRGLLLDIEFNNADLSMSIDYNTKSSIINLTSFVNFEQYKYNIQSYQIKDSDGTECFTVAYIKFCLFPLKCQIKSILYKDYFINEKKEFSKNILINH